MRKAHRIAPALIVLLLVAGCAKRIDTTTGKSAPASPYEQVMSYNASLAQANTTVAKGVITATTTLKPDGTPLLTKAQANAILIRQRQVAQYDEQITAILEKGQSYATANAAQLNDLIGKVRVLAQAMATDAGASPDVALTIQSIANLGSALLTQLQLAGVLK